MTKNQRRILGEAAIDANTAALHRGASIATAMGEAFDAFNVVYDANVTPFAIEVNREIAKQNRQALRRLGRLLR